MAKYPMEVEVWMCPSCHHPYLDRSIARNCCPLKPLMLWACEAGGRHGTEDEAEGCSVAVIVRSHRDGEQPDA